MGAWHRLQSDSLARLVRTGLPRKVLRHLIFSHGVGVGSYILDAGCGQGELVRFLDRLGFFVSGLDESPGDVEVARCQTPHLDFHCGFDDQSVPFAEHRFDLVLVRGLAPYAGSLLSPAALKTTAHLLASVRPGGSLVFLARFDVDANGHEFGHALSCYSRHLSWFPGACTRAAFPDAIVQRDAWRSILAGRPRCGYLSATIQSPGKPISRADWLQAAEVAATTQGEPCCPWSLEATGPANHVEHAA